jgi:hypothetical protein
VTWSDLWRREKVETADHHLVLYHQRLNHGQFQGNRGVVVVVDTPRHRRAVRLSTEGALDARTR